MNIKLVFFKTTVETELFKSIDLILIFSKDECAIQVF